MKKIVIMPGGFHPFHAGHMALYKAAQEAFPSADVFVAATADTSNRPFPFAVKKFLAQQAGVPGNRFIQVKSPFRAEEITQMYDPDNTQLIFVRSEKDAQKQPQTGGVKRDGSAAYLQPYKRNKPEPFSKHGYMAYLPTVQFGPGMTSATEIRAKWPEMTVEEKIGLVKVMYPSTATRDDAAGKIVTMLDEIIGRAVDEGIGRALAGGAMAGALAMTPAAPAQAATSMPTTGNTVATVVIDGHKKVYDLGSMDVKQAGKMLEKKLDSMNTKNWTLTVTDGKSRFTIDTIGGGVREGMNGAQASLMGAPAGGGASTLNPTPTPMANAADRPRKGVRMGVEFDEEMMGSRTVQSRTDTTDITATTGGGVTTRTVQPSTPFEPDPDLVRQKDELSRQLRAQGMTGAQILRDPRYRELSRRIRGIEENNRATKTVKPAGTYRPLNLGGYNTKYLQKIVIQNRPVDGITPQAALAELQLRMNSGDPHTEAPTPEFVQRYLVPKVREATVVNDPEAGLQIRPAGGMGTYDEASLVSNLARKFASMVDMVRNKNYSGLHHVLYRAGVVENMVRALAELEAFQAQQGRRPIARGREIDTTDYLDER